MTARSTSGTFALEMSSSRLSGWEHKPHGPKQAKQAPTTTERVATTAGQLGASSLSTAAVYHLLASPANAARCSLVGTRLELILCYTNVFEKTAIWIFAMLD
ncbi:hypothetical protein CaCOL14_007092 [Colletotrichum acutatum]